MNEFTTKFEAIETEAHQLTEKVDRLIKDVQQLKPQARSKAEEAKRHRLEIELLNMRDFMWIRRG
jgi:outer membrane murein-binding lipoprotein Lpp